MKKLCDVVMLPTEKATPLVKFIGQFQTNKLTYCETLSMREPDEQSQHLYITSDEEIKEGDWFIVELFKITSESDGFHIEQANKLEDVWINEGVTIRRHKNNCRKIIATTDKSPYIQPYEVRIIPQIPEWFTKEFVESQGKIKQVLVQYATYNNGDDYVPMINSLNEIGINIPEEKTYTREDLLLFGMWYSGMTKDKVSNALDRYHKENL